MNGLKENLIRDPTSPHGRTLVQNIRVGSPRIGHLTTSSDQPRASSPINDNYCLNVLKAGLLVGSRETVNCVLSPETPRKTLDIQTPQIQVVNFSVVNHVLSAKWHSQKKDISPIVVNCFQQRKIKICERCFLCRSIVFCQTCNKCPSCSFRSTCRGKTAMLLENLGNSGCRFKSSNILKQGYNLRFQNWPNLTMSPTIISFYVNPHRNLYLLEALHQLITKNENSDFQPIYLGPKIKQPVETHTGHEQIKTFP